MGKVGKKKINESSKKTISAIPLGTTLHYFLREWESIWYETDNNCYVQFDIYNSKEKIWLAEGLKHKIVRKVVKNAYVSRYYNVYLDYAVIIKKMEKHFDKEKYLKIRQDIEDVNEYIKDL